MDSFSSAWVDTRIASVIGTLIAYSAICQVLRYRRIKSLQRKYDTATEKKPLSSMTDEEAYSIQKLVSDAEFPALFEKGLQLALFRTYGIPTISKILAKTAQLGTSENVAKRYADTAVIISEIYSSAPTGERGIEAFARLNYLHGHYRKDGRITNDDMLYTLALFMNHPCEWINRYEWRQLTDIEVCAIATFHKSMGEAMQIKYDNLPSNRTGWRDGLHFYQELDEWAKEYEKKYMVPNDDNHAIATKTKELLLSTVPSFTHGLVAQLMSAAMDDRLREAIKFEPAHPAAKSLLNAFMSARRFFLRYLSLPRFGWQRRIVLSRNQSPEGRRWIEYWSTTPHYVKATFWSRWGPSGLYQLMIGAPRPGDKGMYPEGYLRSNLGPRAFEGKGKDAFEQEKRRIAETRTGGCPFAI